MSSDALDEKPESIDPRFIRDVGRFRSCLVGGGLTIFSIAVGLFVVNAAFIIWIRSPLQSRSFPREVISLLSVPTRWLYPDTGRTGSSADIALIGDSYVNGDGDSFRAGAYQYSLGHFLHSKTGKSFSVYAASGTNLPTSTSFYESGLKGDLWPLFDSIPLDRQPSVIWLFFYEGNDLDDYFRVKKAGFPTVHESLPWSVRFFPLRYYLGRSSGRSAELIWGRREPVGRTPLQDLRDLPNMGRLQGASPSLSEEQVSEAIEFTANEILDFAKSNKTDKICLFYIPSPVTTYQLPKTTSYVVSTGDTIIVSRELNNIRSKKIRESLRFYLGEIVQFVDLTEAIQLAAQSHVLHGSIDPHHFNSVGYESFSEVVLAEGKSCFPAMSDA